MGTWPGRPGSTRRARPRRSGSRECSEGPRRSVRLPRGCAWRPRGGTAPRSGWRRRARARRRGGRALPGPWPSAWSGLLADRAKTAPVGSPTAHSTVPSGAVTTTVPRWTLSTNPPRTTCARIGASVSAALGRVSRGASGTAVSVPERVCERAGPQEARGPARSAAVCGVEPVAPAVGCSRPARPGSGARWGQWGQAPTFWAAALVALRARGAALRAEVAVALVRAVVALAPF